MIVVGRPRPAPRRPYPSRAGGASVARPPRTRPAGASRVPERSGDADGRDAKRVAGGLRAAWPCSGPRGVDGDDWHVATARAMMAGPWPVVTTLIRSKTRVPAIADAVIERGRVVAALDGRRGGPAHPAGRRVGGLGQDDGRRPVRRPRARARARGSRCGEADGSPGRFVTYLAAAVGEIVPGADGPRPRAARRGVGPRRLRRAARPRTCPPGATLVIDDVHLVEDRPPVLAVLRALLDAVAPDAWWCSSRGGSSTSTSAAASSSGRSGDGVGPRPGLHAPRRPGSCSPPGACRRRPRRSSRRPAGGPPGSSSTPSAARARAPGESPPRRPLLRLPRRRGARRAARRPAARRDPQRPAAHGRPAAARGAARRPVRRGAARTRDPPPPPARDARAGGPALPPALPRVPPQPPARGPRASCGRCSSATPATSRAPGHVEEAADHFIAAGALGRGGQRRS